MKGQRGAESDSAANSGVWVWGEIQDHERVLDGSLELLTKGRVLADALDEPLACFTFGLEVEQYLPEIEKYGPDVLYYGSHVDFKHYNDELFVPLLLELVKEHKPSVILFPSTEAGTDFAPRVAWELQTGLTAHVTDIRLVDDAEYGPSLLVMDKPAFGGDLMASIICPNTWPQMATVRPGVFKKAPPVRDVETTRVEVRYESVYDDLVVKQVSAPKRDDPPTADLEDAAVIVAGGQGVGSPENWALLEKLANLLFGKVGASRNAIFKGWAREEQMIGQTGVTVSPDVYLAFGISGQIQHTVGILDSKVIIAVNSDPDAMIFKISDYGVVAKVEEFLPLLVERLEGALISRRGEAGSKQ
ncbi:MAG: electron transfer flavoprotein subunit alpha/FixB family protein [Promethearchaeota archaeon]